MKTGLSLITTSILLISFCGVSLCEEQLTITTYYPAPYGVYREFESRRMVVGDDSMPTADGVINFQVLAANPTFTDEGMIYYSSTEKGFRYFDGSSWSSLTNKCLSRTFTAISGIQECPVGYAIPMAPFAPTSTSGTYLCCPYQ